jgi:Ser/Thr protein kinase RdoA (MazF antagonist)
MAQPEQPLDGGNVNPEVVRVGDTVRRAVGPWTATVHGLLNHLADRSYPAPRPLGLDGEGREVLTFIPGDCVHPNHLDEIASDVALRRVGRLIADFHEAQRDYTPSANSTWRSEGRDPTGSTEVIAHNDLAPWNLVTGPGGWTFIDWDLAAPGRRLWDLGWAVHSFVGLWPDSTLSDEQTASRIAAFCDGAGVTPSDRSQLLDVVVERVFDHVAMLRAKASSGDAIYVRLVKDGHADTWQRGASHVAAKRATWLCLLNQ